jgi:hypothetical protein
VVGSGDFFVLEAEWCSESENFKVSVKI